jgi:citrate synthase
VSRLKQKFFEKVQAWRPRTAKLAKDFADVKVGEIDIGQVIGGARDVKCLVTDISYLDPAEGIRFRDMTIPEVLEKLPKPEGCSHPYVEGHVYLLLTGDVPTEKEIAEVAAEFRSRAHVPRYVFDVLRAMPRDTHPMTMLSAAVLSMQRDSVFAKQYNEGINKNDYWDPTYEDGMNLLARLPEIAAYIYRMKYRSDTIIPPNPALDLGGNFAHMMGIAKPYDCVSRLYFVLHSDHESGNVSAHAGHLISSALSDIYYSISGMINGLAGPLHGLATQEVLRWIQDVMARMGGRVPSEEELRQFVWDTLKSGQVVPGFGHAVLRKTDPRYMAQRELCLKHLPEDPLFKYVDMLYRIVPPVLLEQGKAKNPWPNVDAQSGVIQWYYGIQEYDFYTVLFAVGRALGVVSNIIWDRALGYPIERPKSVTTAMLEDLARGAKAIEADMSDKKIIAVVGSTGAQGGGLVQAILADSNGGFAARAITRDPSKDKAKALAAQGAEVVSADLDDVKSLEKAFAGAYAVYGVTNFWEHFSGEKETAQAKNIADAARAAGVKHVIWSTLEDTRILMTADDKRMPMLQKKYRVPHFDAKAEANASFAGLPVTFLVTSFYWDNLYSFGLAPKKGADGQYEWAFPMGNSKLAGMAAEDIGKVAYGIFKAGQQYFGKTVGIVSENLTLAEMGAKISAGMGVGPIRYNAVDADAYRGFGFPGADEMGNMFQVYRDFEKEITGARSADVARQLNPQLQNFDQFIAKNKSKIEAAMNPA